MTTKVREIIKNTIYGVPIIREDCTLYSLVFGSNAIHWVEDL